MLWVFYAPNKLHIYSNFLRFPAQQSKATSNDIQSPHTINVSPSTCAGWLESTEWKTKNLSLCSWFWLDPQSFCLRMKRGASFYHNHNFFRVCAEKIWIEGVNTLHMFGWIESWGKLNLSFRLLLQQDAWICSIFRFLFVTKLKSHNSTTVFDSTQIWTDNFSLSHIQHNHCICKLNVSKSFRRQFK